MISQKDHKLGIFADQLKVQKEKGAQAEAAAQRAEEEVGRLREELNNHTRSKTVRRGDCRIQGECLFGSQRRRVQWVCGGG